jgi:predicted acyltransferase
MSGRPALGSISGLFLGLFAAVLLQQYGVRPLDTFSLIGLPIIGLIVGLVFSMWAPFGKK